MSSSKSGPDAPLSLGRRAGLEKDARTGSGYGVLKTKHHFPRPKGSSFPYTEESEEIDVDVGISDVDIEQILKKIATPFKSSDPLIGRSIDHSSYAGGNARVAIGEASGKSLVPYPGMYKKRIQVGGGVNSPKLISPGQYNRTGTYRGWSHAPVPLEISDDQESDEALEKVRELVSMILSSNINKA